MTETSHQQEYQEYQQKFSLEQLEQKISSSSSSLSKLVQIWKNGQYWQSFHTSELPGTLEDLPLHLREMTVGLLLYYGNDLDRSISPSIIEKAENDFLNNENELFDIRLAFGTIKRFLNRQNIIEQRKNEGFVSGETKSFRPTDLMVGSQRKLNPLGFLMVKNNRENLDCYQVFLGEPVVFMAENAKRESMKPKDILLDVKNDQQKAISFLQKVTESEFFAVFTHLGNISVSLQGMTCTPLKFVVR